MKEDPAIEKMRQAFTKSGLSLDEVGRRMGYEGDTARKATWQLLNKTNDPRLSMVRKFAEAVGVPVRNLV